MKRCGLGFLLLFFVVLPNPLPAAAEGPLRIAVAANYLNVFQAITQAFEKKIGIEVEATFSSTGSLYAQIANGAPYDLFLSADEGRPAKLHHDGLADVPFIYARGQCVLWSAKLEFCRAKDWREALKDEKAKRIAVANPKTAPYGAAAQTALQKAALWEGLQKKWITAGDIAQAFQYAAEGATDAGFCALSSAMTAKGKSGCFYPVAEAPAIVQSACILKRTRQRAAAERFAAFLLSPEVAALKNAAGYL